MAGRHQFTGNKQSDEGRGGRPGRPGWPPGKPPGRAGNLDTEEMKMARHVFSGNALNYEFNPRSARAYCEGMAYRQSGTLLGKPITDNPYAAPNLDEVDAWDAGWTLADLQAPAGTMPATNCAVYGAVVDT